MSDLEETLAFQIRAAGLPEPEREFRFLTPRRWRFDFFWKWTEMQPTLSNGSRYVTKTVALEVEGGTHTNGRHIRAQGFENDCEKYNEAALLGVQVLRVTSAMVEDGRALRLIQRALGREVA